MSLQPIQRHTVKTLQKAIDEVNQDLYNKYLIVKLNQIASLVKGHHYKEVYKSFSYEIIRYELCTDYERLESLSNTKGYWNSFVNKFNSELIIKGGFEYKNELNNKYLSSLK